MTVGELIARLKEFDPSAKVVVDAYEAGVDELKEVYGVHIAIDPYAARATRGLVGDYDTVDIEERDFAKKDGGRATEPAVYLPRPGGAY